MAKAFPKAELFKGDITGQWVDEGGGVLIHCAAALRNKSVEEQFKVNVWGTYNLFDNVQPDYAVYVSTQTSPDANPYALTKRLGEQIALNYNCGVLRLTYPYGPGMRDYHLVSRLKQGIKGDPDQVLMATPISEVVAEVKRMVERKVLGINVLPGHPMTLKELSECSI